MITGLIYWRGSDGRTGLMIHFCRAPASSQARRSSLMSCGRMKERGKKLNSCFPKRARILERFLHRRSFLPIWKEPGKWFSWNTTQRTLWGTFIQTHTAVRNTPSMQMQWGRHPVYRHTLQWGQHVQTHTAVKTTCADTHTAVRTTCTHTLQWGQHVHTHYSEDNMYRHTLQWGQHVQTHTAVKTTCADTHCSEDNMCRHTLQWGHVQTHCSEDNMYRHRHTHTLQWGHVQTHTAVRTTCADTLQWR